VDEQFEDKGFDIGTLQFFLAFLRRVVSKKEPILLEYVTWSHRYIKRRSGDQDAAKKTR